jgi:membrane protease YdiL (CAAX protease family)
MLPAPLQAPGAGPPTPRFAERVVALVEVMLCSDYPTQIVIGTTLGALGWAPLTAAGQLSLGYVVLLSAIDTVVLLSLIVLFLRSHGERPRQVLLGRRAVAPEIKAGLPLILVALLIGTAVVVAVQVIAPSLHNVSRNPLQDLIDRPLDVWLFALVVVVAGGVREEIQRAFVLHRFEQSLGGAGVGIAVGSIAFGAGHLVQGVDAAIATGLLGVFWGVIYLRRRSVVAPMVSHAGFNLLEIAQALLTPR